MTTGEGADMPPPGRAAGLELSGTVQQQLVFLNTHWGSKYSFTAPAKPRDRWTAAAKFAQHEELTGETAAELLERVRAHYQANKPAGDGPL
jgi:hypothetical protein